MNRNLTVALVDDHSLLRSGLAALVTSLGYDVILECCNGQQLIDKLNKENLPEIVLMDIRMPEMDGFEATQWLRKNHPLVNVLALSMYDDEISVIRMIRSGARGYILKDTDQKELRQAIESIMSKGFYYSDLVSGKLVNQVRDEDEAEDNKNIKDNRKLVLGLNEKYIEFLKLATTEMTYKEIAEQMNLSPRTIDGYRDELFEKLGVKSRVGLVLFSIKNGIVRLN
jgi:two-component system invasion response regulator UvrY